MKSLVSIAAALLLTAGVAQANTVKLTGTVAVEGGKVLLKLRSAKTVLTGDLTDDLDLLEGKTITVKGTVGPNGLTIQTVVSPQRVEITAVARKGAAGKVALVTQDKRTIAPFGRTGLAPLDRERTFDAWFFPKSRQACLIAVEAETTLSWTFLRRDAKELSVPVGYIRGKSRSVWLTGSENGFAHIRRGSDAGWIRSGDVSVLERVVAKPTAAGSAGGLVQGVSR